MAVREEGEPPMETLNLPGETDRSPEATLSRRGEHDTLISGGGQESPDKLDKTALPQPAEGDPLITWKHKYLPWFILKHRWIRPKEDRRRVLANDKEYNRKFKYDDNYVKTSKYNLITFLPLNLIEQFTRVANLYFLILVFIQLIPDVVPEIPAVSSLSAATTIIPLLGVLAVTAVKDAFDDIKRHISDWRLNHRKSQVLRDGSFVKVLWKDIEVGDIVKLERNDFVTADIVVLGASQPNSLCFLETAELDGETNLKVRQALTATHNAFVVDTEKGAEPILQELSKFNGFIACEAPNNNLHSFEGTLVWDGLEHGGEGLSLDQVLLRGCRVRNTDWVVGLVVYAGHQTKLMKNTGKTLYKRTQLDRQMNKMVIAILLFLACLVVCCVIGSLIWEIYYGQYFLYVEYESPLDSPAALAFYQILSNIVILNTLVPISLYVSVEIIRLGLSLLINRDSKMYHPDEDVPAQAHTTTLNEELGQIDYIFSDKTGTLTRNVMTFLKCCIGPDCVKYGDRTGSQRKCDLKWNPYVEEEFVYYDRKLVEACRCHQPDVARYFKLLALCHTVLINHKEGGDFEYNAQSPDEAALVSAARNFGYVFKARDPHTITLEVVSKEVGKDGRNEFRTLEYKILNILDFNNDRKRMSVIVQFPEDDPEDPEALLLLCKGADVKIHERLKNPDSKEWMTTETALQDYAKEGLRTLCMAYRSLDVEEYKKWDEKHHEASTSLDDRQEKLAEVYEEIEKEFILLGSSAIEDKLQDGVPEAIYNLSKANLKIWVLTGDKMETAINIGYSCKLLREDMQVHCIDGDNSDDIVRDLQAIVIAHREVNNNFKSSTESNVSQTTNGKKRFALVVSGGSLKTVFDGMLDKTFLEAASVCNSVICCRVTPLQKRKVVNLIKEEKKAITLAIGDGANDVGMIKAAHIGVGISGREGRQAVLASDFSFGQFRFLENLLLVHGRWSYHRMAVFLRYFFYKNFAFTFAQFLFAIFCGFTGQTVYGQGYITLYNVIYSSLPIIALAILDQDVDEDCCRMYPQLYILGQKHVQFNSYLFVLSLVKGILNAGVIFFVLMGATLYNVLPGGGFEVDYETMTYMAAGVLTLVVNIQIALDTLLWTPITHFFILFSILAYFFVTAFFSAESLYGNFDSLITPIFINVGVPQMSLNAAFFYFYCMLAIVLIIFPVIFKRMVMVMLRPNLIDYVRLGMYQEKTQFLKDVLRKEITGKQFKPKVSRKPTVYSHGELVSRSGYAFSHQEGYADLVMTGKAFSPQEMKKSHRRSVLHSSYYGQENDDDISAHGMSRSSSRRSLRSKSEQDAWAHERGEEDVDVKSQSEGTELSKSMEMNSFTSSEGIHEGGGKVTQI